MPSFYANKENLVHALGCYLAIFSEGRDPIVPVMRNADGTINVENTLDMTSYRDFPADEKAHWLSKE
jgi:hypothetical protein